MFTNSEIDRVMNQLGLVDGGSYPVTIEAVKEIVLAAQDCGVLDSRIAVWKIQDEPEILVTLDLNGVRVASLCVSHKHIAPEREISSRSSVLHVLIWANQECNALLSAFSESRRMHYGW